jgi:hypothetical protein
VLRDDEVDQVDGGIIAVLITGYYPRRHRLFSRTSAARPDSDDRNISGAGVGLRTDSAPAQVHYSRCRGHWLLSPSAPATSLGQTPASHRCWGLAYGREAFQCSIGLVFVRSFLRRASRAAYILWSRWLQCGTEDSGLSRESPIVIFAPAFVGAEVVPNLGWLKVELALKTSHPGGLSLCELFALQRGDQIKPPHHKEAPAAVWVRTAGAGGTLCR